MRVAPALESFPACCRRAGAALVRLATQLTGSPQDGGDLARTYASLVGQPPDG